MTHEYVPLRERLAQGSPELHAALLRSWSIAEKEWLPAVTGNKGSFNSFPHLRNLEHYADDILRQSEQLNLAGEKLDMTSVEIYMLLAGILFHDIGRTKEGKWHAHTSRDLIREKFADLGIEGKNLAFILADICCFHDCSSGMAKELDLRDHAVSPYGVVHCKRLAILLKFIDNLDTAYTRVLPHYLHDNEANIIEGLRRNTSDVRVDLQNAMVVTTIGFPRSSLHRTTLTHSGDQRPVDPKTLAFVVSKKKDSQDGIPWGDVELVLNPDCTFGDCDSLADLSGITYFCKAVAQASVDEEEYQRLRKEKIVDKWVEGIEKISELSDDQRGLVEGLTEAIRKSASTYKKYCRDKKQDLEGTIAQLFEIFISKLTADDYADLLAIDVPEDASRNEPFHAFEVPGRRYLPMPSSNAIGGPSDLTPYLIMRNIAFANLNRYDKIDDLSRLVFLVLAGNVRCNAHLLKNDLERSLAIYGLPVRGWLIEYDEHLFTSAGRETFEPSLSKDFLRDVLVSMCQLSGGMFDRRPYTYRTLAAKLRVGDVELARTAVRRIGIVSRHKDSSQTSGNQACYIVEFTWQNWRWCPPNLENSEDPKQPNECDVKHNQKWVLDRINGLAEPDDDIIPKLRKHDNAGTGRG